MMTMPQDYSQILERSNCKTLAECRVQALITKVYKACNGISPGYIREIFLPKICMIFARQTSLKCFETEQQIMGQRLLNA